MNKTLFRLLALALVVSCSRPTKIDDPSIKEVNASPKPTTFNFYIENSGSMKGYFSGNGSSQLETLITEYYNRLHDSFIDGDTITLNFVNTSVEKYFGSEKNYLKDAQFKCTSSYTKIDEILEMAMDSVNNNIVNIIISDFCFETNFGNLESAQSHITSLFTSKIKNNRDMSVSIFKYMVNFNGKYFPGGIPCKKPMPIYFWAFGNSCSLKRFVNLKLKSQSCGQLIMQLSKKKEVEINLYNKRATDGKSIFVKEWDKDRSSNKYVADLFVDLSDILLDEHSLMDKEHYYVNSSSNSTYIINDITKVNNRYKFTISTSKPAPGNLEIIYKLEEPEWVNKYNFECVGLPKDSTTYGIKYLIEGVFDAFHNQSEDYFNFNITLQ